MLEVKLVVVGMTCNSCVNRVDEGLSAINNVNSTLIDLDSGLVKINLNDEIDDEKLKNVIRKMGYSIKGDDVVPSNFDWKDKGIWKQSAHNTKWCLIGCSIGDFGTIAFFQYIIPDSGWATMSIMILAMINGLLTSIALETVILSKQLALLEAFKTACGMSLISMISMEAAMNLVDVLITGGAMLTWYVIPLMLIAGFITPWPYNYWRLKKYGKACH